LSQTFLLIVDVNAIEELAAIAERCNLEEIEVEWNGNRVRIRKNWCGNELRQFKSDAPASREMVVAESRISDSGTQKCEFKCISSPMIGTFYRSSAPGRPALVEVGSDVNANTVVCIIEAMKVMNEIPSELEGTIVDVLVKDGQAVEFGQPLFRISAKN
jgi:acetyl-CoA carboxylase biotin carboxyl carrier protein